MYNYEISFKRGVEGRHHSRGREPVALQMLVGILLPSASENNIAECIICPQTVPWDLFSRTGVASAVPMGAKVSLPLPL